MKLKVAALSAEQQWYRVKWVGHANERAILFYFVVILELDPQAFFI